MNKVKQLLNRHAKEILIGVENEYPNAEEVTCAAVEGGVIRSANGKIQQIKYSIEIEVIEKVSNATI